MQVYTSLECNGAVDVGVETCANGLKFSGKNPFECITKGNKIQLSSRNGSGSGSIFLGNGIQVNNVSGVCNSFNSVGGCTFIQTGQTQRFIIDGVDVTDDVKQAVDRKKGLDSADGGGEKEDDTFKRQHLVTGTCKLSDISASGNCRLLVHDAHSLDQDMVDLQASGTAILQLPPHLVQTLSIMTSGCGVVKGHVTARRLRVKASGSSSVSQFYAQSSAKLSASGCGNICVSASVESSVDKSKSGCAQITITR